MPIEINLPNYEKTKKQLHAINKDAEGVVKRTVSDFKSRAPAWVSAAVTETYGIAKSEVKGAFSGAKKTAGRVKLKGTTIDNIGLVYSGRVLTPLRFKMKPTAPPARRPMPPYQITAEIYKGKRKGLASNAFLGSNKGGGFIPFQRTSESRLPIKSIKTVSVPQMLGNETVSTQIQQNIEDGLEKRLEHHLAQALKRQG